MKAAVLGPNKPLTSTLRQLLARALKAVPLLVLYQLQAEEVLALHLIQLRDDVLYRAGDLWLQEVLERVDAAIRQLDGLVENDERRLQTGPTLRSRFSAPPNTRGCWICYTPA